MFFPISFSAYLFASWLLLGLLVWDASLSHQQFFPTVVALTNSKFFSIGCTHAILATILAIARFANWLFFGTLQRLERQRVTEGLFYHCVEMFFGAAYLSPAFSSAVGGQVLAVVLFHSFHSVAQMRQDSIESELRHSKVNTLRLCIALLICVWVDLIVVYTTFCGFSLNLSFLFFVTFVDMLISALVVTLKLLLFEAERYFGVERFSQRPMLKFYLRIVSELSKAILYIVCFAVLCYGIALPLHMVRGVIVHTRTTLKTLRNFHRYQKLVMTINKSLEDATEEDLARDRTCAICYEELTVRNSKKLKCSHCFHVHCLRRWFEDNAICPYCRQNVDLSPPPPQQRPQPQREQQQPQAPPQAPPQQQQQQQLGDGNQQGFVLRPEDEVMMNFAFEAYRQLYAQQAKLVQQNTTEREDSAAAAAAAAAEETTPSPRQQVDTPLRREASERLERQPSEAMSQRQLVEEVEAYREYEDAVRAAKERLEMRLSRSRSMEP